MNITWPSNPSIYEINTWVWLRDLSDKYGKVIDLSCVPSADWGAIAEFGFDAVWLMGVWERSPAGINIANNNPGLLLEFRSALPDFKLEDNVGSPYCIRNYFVDQHLGGQQALAVARDELSQRGMRLILDFVPNHVAPDHPWAAEHPHYFINGSVEDAKNQPSAYLSIGEKVIACGKDPYFPAWPDVIQLNVFDPALRLAAIDTLSNIANQCDGVRCDMAMLMFNSIFERTWAGRAGPTPKTEYWLDLIPAVKQHHPNFLFIAEAYWDLEWQLQQQGFDYCYDKRLYDRLEHDSAESVRLHLTAGLEYQRKLLRFIENHDEPRASAAFPPPKDAAAAVVSATLPGAKLFNEGQFEGWKVKVPVFLDRRRQESANIQCQAFYLKLLNLISKPAFHEGDWTLCKSTEAKILAWTWTYGQTQLLIVINLSPHSSQALIPLPWQDMRDQTLSLTGYLFEEEYEREGNDLLDPGLYVDLQPWYAQCFVLREA